jgi:hypothetical protein
MWDMMRGKQGGQSDFVAAEDAQGHASSAPGLVDAANGESWYTQPGNAVDAALVALCRLRRAAAGDRKASEGGDAAVRAALEQSSPEAVVWLASRVVSYMDEHGFPEDVEPWLDVRG